MLKPAVERATEQIRAVFSGIPVIVREDGEGGAYIIVEEVDPGPPYEQRTTWIGFRITFQYPYADTYPHFVRGDLARADKGALGEGMSQNHTFEGRGAVQISRRSNHLDPTTETALLKLEKVLTWLASRS